MGQREGSGCCLPPDRLPLLWWVVEPDNVCRLGLAGAGGTRGGGSPQAITLLTQLARKSNNKGLFIPCDLQWLDKCTSSGTRRTQGDAEYSKGTCVNCGCTFVDPGSRVEELELQQQATRCGGVPTLHRTLDHLTH